MATIRFIEHRNNDPRKQLNQLMHSPESSVLEGKTKFNADKTVNSLYLTILQEAFGNDNPEDCCGPGYKPPLSLCNCCSPQLQHSRCIPPLLSAHSLLILHDDTSQPLQPFHKSFPDFIVDPDWCVNRRFLVCPSKHHTELIFGCLKLLNQKLEKNMCKLPDLVINSVSGPLSP